MSKNCYMLSSNNELYHWKYIKKEKVNGKWRYYYDNDRFGVKEFIETNITGDAYKQHSDEHSAKAQQAKKLYESARVGTDRIRYRNKNGTKNNKYWDQLLTSRNISNTHHDKMLAERSKASDIYSKYRHKSLAGIADNLIWEGQYVVRKMFKKLTRTN